MESSISPPAWPGVVVCNIAIPPLQPLALSALGRPAAVGRPLRPAPCLHAVRGHGEGLLRAASLRGGGAAAAGGAGRGHPEVLYLLRRRPGQPARVVQPRHLRHHGHQRYPAPHSPTPSPCPAPHPPPTAHSPRPGAQTRGTATAGAGCCTSPAGRATPTGQRTATRMPATAAPWAA